MINYKIEGGIDFYAELYKSLDIEESEQKTEEDNNLCLITNQPLYDKYIQMECGHKFNYTPLYLDIKNHKQKFNGMEGSSSRLNADEIRCPYCRKKQKGLLPYYEELNLSKVHGVNFIDEKIKTCSSSHNSNYKTCEFLTLNPSFDPSGNNPGETNSNNSGNCKFLKCFHMGTKINHHYGSEQGENYGDEKHYCWNHKKQVIKKYKQEIKDKAKDEAKKAKLIAKEEEKKAKDEAKQKEKDEKKKVKEEKKTKKSKPSVENVVLGPSVITDLAGNELIVGCVEILKSGPNKGKHCGCKIVSENVCKRHFLMNHKELIVNN